MLGINVYDGDSLMLGSHCVSNNAFLTAQKMSPGFASCNLAIGGQTIAQIVAAAPYRIDTLLAAIPGIKRYILWGGGNDLDLASMSGQGDQVLYNQLLRVKAARAAGFNEIVLCSITPRASNNPTFEQDRQYVRGKQLAGITGADRIADIGGDPQIGAAGAYTNTSLYFGDDVHLIDKGSVIAGGIIGAAFNS